MAERKQSEPKVPNDVVRSDYLNDTRLNLSNDTDTLIRLQEKRAHLMGMTLALRLIDHGATPEQLKKLIGEKLTEIAEDRTNYYLELKNRNFR